MSELRPAEFITGLNAPREQFVANIAVNMARGLPTLQIKRAMLVAGGPSAADFLDEIRQRQQDGWELYTVNGAHDWLVGQGIIPDYCTVLESNEVVNTFIRKPHGMCQYYVASQCHPSIIDRLTEACCDIVLWHAALDEPAHKIIAEADPNATIFAGAQTTGLHTINIAWTNGVKKMALYGMDSSHRDDGTDHAYDNSQQAHTEAQEFFYEGKRYLSVPTWANQAQTFARLIPYYFRLGMRFEIKGDGLLQHMARKVTTQLMEQLAEREKASAWKDLPQSQGGHAEG